MQNDDQYLQDFRVYIGDSEDHTQNEEVPGSPFMRLDDPDMFYDGQVGNGAILYGMWKFGKEVFCSHTGRYFHLISDKSAWSHKGGYEQTICSLGIMGYSIARIDTSLDPPVSVTLNYGGAITFTVGYVQLEQQIGDTVDFKVRQKAGEIVPFPFTITENSIDGFDVEIQLAKPNGTYDLILETYDDMTTAKVALMTEIVEVTILDPIPPSFVSPIQASIDVIEGTSASWTLPEIDPGQDGYSHAIIFIDSTIQNNLSYEEDQGTIAFSFDAEIGTFSQSLTSLVTITLVGEETGSFSPVYSQVVNIEPLFVDVGILIDTPFDQDESDELDSINQADNFEATDEQEVETEDDLSESKNINENANRVVFEECDGNQDDFSAKTLDTNS